MPQPFAAEAEHAGCFRLLLGNLRDPGSARLFLPLQFFSAWSGSTRKYPRRFYARTPALAVARYRLKERARLARRILKGGVRPHLEIGDAMVDGLPRTAHRRTRPPLACGNLALQSGAIYWRVWRHPGALLCAANLPSPGRGIRKHILDAAVGR